MQCPYINLPVAWFHNSPWQSRKIKKLKMAPHREKPGRTSNQKGKKVFSGNKRFSHKLNCEWNFVLMKGLHGCLWSAVPNLLGTRDRFCGRQFFLWGGWGGGTVRALRRAMGNSRWRFAHSPAAHLLMGSPVPNRPRTTKGVGDCCLW